MMTLLLIDLSLDIPQKFVNTRPGKGRQQCCIQGILHTEPGVGGTINYLLCRLSCKFCTKGRVRRD
jgi:hypothetical protein